MEKPKSINPKNNAKIKTNTKTIMVEPIQSSYLGHTTLLSSMRTSLKNCTISFITDPLLVACYLHLFGRPGGIRTPNPQIWSLPLYQLELLAYKHYAISFLYAYGACGSESRTSSMSMSQLTFSLTQLAYNYALYTLHMPGEWLFYFLPYTLKHSLRLLF